MFHIRQAVFADRPTIARHRVSLFHEIDLVSLAQLDVLQDATVAYLADAMPAGQYVGWLATPAVTPERVVAGCGVLVRNVAPFPMRWADGEEGIAGGRQVLVVNVYTEPEFRRLGLARRLLTTMLDWARLNGVDSVILHATDAARPLYASLGFEPTNEMRFMGDLR
jgi:GNAT superfamily N-acetyltransferase